MIAALTRYVIARPKAVLIAGIIVLVALGLAGVGVADRLQAGGYVDPKADSIQAFNQLENTFGRGGLSLVFAVQDDAGIDGADARATGEAIVAGLRGDARVLTVQSAWTDPQAAAALRSTDGRTGLVVAGVGGGDLEGQKNAADIVADMPPPIGDATVITGGQGVVYAEVNKTSETDLLRAELVAIPISFLLLIWVFGGVIAAALPIVIGVAAIIGTTGILRGITEFADVSVFALNLTTAMGLALAIDYTLLIVSRYREEVAAGSPRDAALVRAMSTAGRTIVFSAITVGLSLAAMALFPMYFLRSFAYAGVAVVALAALATLVLAPALLTLLGDRIDALDVHRLWRRRRGGDARVAKPVEEGGWFRFTRVVLARSLPIGVTIVAILLLLGAPFLGIRFGYPDDRVLPKDSASHVVGDLLREDFAQSATGLTSVVMPDAGGPSPELDRYAAELSRVADVAAVVSPDGTYLRGVKAGPGDPTARRGEAVLLSVSTVEPGSDAAADQLDALHAVAAPHRALFSGAEQLDRDSVESILDSLPLVLAVIAVTTFILLFLLTGSLLLPLKALVMNVLSLSAVFGALVWIFQEGHLGGLGTTVTGSLIANMPVLMFCIAFGLSMDYEVFLLARIKEHWDGAPEKTRGANDDAVAYGIAHTGRVVTAAALLMAIVFAAIGTGGVSFMRMFGVGMTIAVLLDATVIRMLLVPSFMRLMGTVNWWAPPPLARFQARYGWREG